MPTLRMPARCRSAPRPHVAGLLNTQLCPWLSTGSSHSAEGQRSSAPLVSASAAAAGAFLRGAARPRPPGTKLGHPHSPSRCRRTSRPPTARTAPRAVRPGRSWASPARRSAAPAPRRSASGAPAPAGCCGQRKQCAAASPQKLRAGVRACPQGRMLHHPRRGVTLRQVHRGPQRVLAERGLQRPLPAARLPPAPPSADTLLPLQV